MTPSTLEQMLSGVRVSTFSLTGIDMSPWAQSAVAKLPWDLHPLKQVKVLNRASAYLDLDGFVLEDITCGLRVEQYGGSPYAKHKKAVSMGTNPSGWKRLYWAVDGTLAPSDVFARVKDASTANGISTLLAALRSGATAAANMADVEQATLLEEIAMMIAGSLENVQAGSMAYPALRHPPLDATQLMV